MKFGKRWNNNSKEWYYPYKKHSRDLKSGIVGYQVYYKLFKNFDSFYWKGSYRIMSQI